MSPLGNGRVTIAEMEEGRKADEGPESGWVVQRGEQVPVKGKPPTCGWEGKALQQEEGTPSLWPGTDLGNLGGRSGKVERKGWRTGVGEGAAGFG